jgi:hypothetical protein
MVDLYLRVPTGNGRETKVTNMAKLTNWRPVYVALAREHRFAGLLPEGCEWTVAHHLLLVAHILQHVLKASPNVVLAGLGHDIPEGMGLRDLPSPVKRLMRDLHDEGYDLLHEEADRAVDTYLGVAPLSYEDVCLLHEADALALRVEQTFLQDVTSHVPCEPDRLDYYELADALFDGDLKAFNNFHESLELVKGISHMTAGFNAYGMADVLQDYVGAQMRICRGEATQESIMAENKAIVEAKIMESFNKRYP